MNDIRKYRNWTKDCKDNLKYDNYKVKLSRLEYCVIIAFLFTWQ